MEKETVIANLRAELAPTDDLRGFFSRFAADQNAWFAREEGELFLAEFGHEWNGDFAEVAQSFYDQYFRDLGVPEGLLPRVKVTDSRRGSWIIEAVLALPAAIGTVYAVLQGIADLPELAEKLEKTKKQVQQELAQRFRAKVRQRLEPTISHSALAQQAPPAVIPANTVSTSFSIDARPLRGLTPDAVKAHAIHLAVGMSRSAISVENLGDSRIENLRIGLFKSASQRHSWNFSDAFSKNVPSLSEKQSVSIAIQEFLSQSGQTKFYLLDPSPLYVDCWLQDNNGIYLFNFYLE